MLFFIKPVLTTALLVLSLCCFSQGKLEISSGTSVLISNGAYLVIDNANLVNNGSLPAPSGGGTLKFTGSGDISLSGSGTTTLHQLEVALSGTNKLNLQKNISIASSLTFTGGLLNLNNSVADLGTAGLLNNESENSRAYTTGTGYIQATATLNAPSSVNPGNLGALISSSQNLGTTTIRRGHQSQVNSFGNGNSILRYFDIDPANNAGLNATLRFLYFDAELNGLDENLLTFWKSATGTAWTDAGVSSRNTTANYAEKTGISDFSRWTLSNPGNALPVIFTVINAKCSNDNVIITWQTAQEFNSKEFEVEKSRDGNSWVAAGSVNAAGNSSTMRSYSFTDQSASPNTLYRISEITVSGRKTYSPTIRSSCGQTEALQIWPNPVLTSATVQVTSVRGTPIYFELYDSKGRLLIKKHENLLQGTNFISLSLERLPTGVYMLTAKWGSNERAIKITKQ